MYSLIRRLLFLLDAEDAHDFTVAQINRVQQIPIVLQAIAAICRVPTRPRMLWGMEFRSPIGIAAGFDKNAVMMPFLAALGFGFLEVGTVTLHPQAGNPKPRVFRDATRHALINRLGFNNDGAEAVAERLQSFRRRIPVFVNIGKNRDVPLERAADAFAQCYLRVARWADGCVLNVSSPNTPGLRELQRAEHLERVLTLVRTLREEMPHSGPILIKIAPDLDHMQIDEVCSVCTRLADGMVCTNTTLTSDGGLSGRPLFDRSTEVLREVRDRVGLNFPLIGVGGVFTADDVRAKFAAGADLVQLYTGMIYEGPFLPARLARELAGRGKP